jgi:hypothetical protein
VKPGQGDEPGLGSQGQLVGLGGHRREWRQKRLQLAEHAPHDSAAARVSVLAQTLQKNRKKNREM